MIGYPGLDQVMVGGHGLWRAGIAVHGASGYSGSRRSAVGAVSRAAHLVRLLDASPLPGAAGSFPLPPKLTVTYCHGGEGFSAVSDRCEIGVGVRATPGFGARAAEDLVRAAVSELDALLSTPRPTEVTAWAPGRRTGPA
jgi:succinyl-diaminopimelate desuccinylase